jgi:hypothetical protein
MIDWLGARTPVGIILLMTTAAALVALGVAQLG